MPIPRPRPTPTTGSKAAATQQESPSSIPTYPPLALDQPGLPQDLQDDAKSSAAPDRTPPKYHTHTPHRRCARQPATTTAANRLTQCLEHSCRLASIIGRQRLHHDRRTAQLARRQLIRHTSILTDINASVQLERVAITRWIISGTIRTPPTQRPLGQPSAAGANDHRSRPHRGRPVAPECGDPPPAQLPPASANSGSPHD